MREQAVALPEGPVLPDYDVLEQDIIASTTLRREAGDALPVIPGTTHISKVAFPKAPNITVWNYIIQVSYVLSS